MVSGVCFSTVLNMHRMPVWCLVFVFNSVKHAHDAHMVSSVCFSTVLNMHRMPVRCLEFVSVQC